MGTKRHIEVIARGLLVRDSRALLCRSQEGGYLYLPGGHVEFGEPAAAALEREFFEETGLRVEARGCALVTEGAFSDGFKEHHELNLVFHVEPAGELPERVGSREAGIGFEWVDLAAIVGMDVRPGAVRAWLAGGGRIEPDELVGWVSEMKIGAKGRDGSDR